MTTWECGVRLTPMTVEGDPPRRLLGIVWAYDGYAMGVEVFDTPEVTDAEIVATYQKAVNDPPAGAPRSRPSRVRVENAALAKRLRPLLPGVKIEIGPTPSVDHLIRSLADSLGVSAPDDRAVFLRTPAVWHGELRRVARELDDTEPWEVVPPDPALVVQLPTLGMPDGRIAVMGHNGETYGLMLFFEAAAFETFEALADADPKASRASMPRCLSVTIEDIGEPDAPEDHAAIVRAFEHDGQRPPSEAELTIAVVAASALARFIDDAQKLLEVPAEWGLGIERSYRVVVRGQEIDAVIAARLPKKPSPKRPSARRR